jgi:hypothetical protein
MHLLLIIPLLMIVFPALARLVGSMVLWVVVAAVALAIVGMVFR